MYMATTQARERITIHTDAVYYVASIKLDIWMVRPPDDESADDGECESEGVGRLSFGGFEELVLGGVHDMGSHATSGFLGAGISGS